jgi:acetyl esterase
MKWFWSNYLPDKQKRKDPKASLEDLKGLPEAMIINGEFDVLRDEGDLMLTNSMMPKSK